MKNDIRESRAFRYLGRYIDIKYHKKFDVTIQESLEDPFKFQACFAEKPYLEVIKDKDGSIKLVPHARMFANIPFECYPDESEENMGRLAMKLADEAMSKFGYKEAVIEHPDKEEFTIYKCPNCGGVLKKNEKGDLVCEHCGTVCYK